MLAPGSGHDCLVSASLPDPDWYLDHVVVPAGPDRSPVGPVRAWQAQWAARARELASRGDDLLDLAAGQGFVLTRSQARAHGVSDAEVRRLLRNGTWTSPRFGVVAIIPDARGVGPAVAATAAVLVRPEHVISHRSAAVLHGLPLLRLPMIPEVTAVVPSTLGRRFGVAVRSAALCADELSAWYGAPVTTAARTVMDVARGERRAGLVAADAALHERLVTPDDLACVSRRTTGWPGARAAREIVALASALAESPLESLVRLSVLDAGLPAPQLQVRVDDPADGWWCRVDMLWPEPRVVLEADGKIKYSGVELWREKRRQLRLERLGYRVVRAIWSDVVHDPRGLIEHLRTYMRAQLPR